jgi:hypothetical protein
MGGVTRTVEEKKARRRRAEVSGCGHGVTHSNTGKEGVAGQYLPLLAKR